MLLPPPPPCLFKPGSHYSLLTWYTGGTSPLPHVLGGPRWPPAANHLTAKLTLWQLPVELILCSRGRGCSPDALAASALKQANRCRVLQYQTAPLGDAAVPAKKVHRMLQTHPRTPGDAAVPSRIYPGMVEYQPPNVRGHCNTGYKNTAGHQSISHKKPGPATVAVKATQSQSRASLKILVADATVSCNYTIVLEAQAKC